MYIIERRKFSSSTDKFESIEVVRSTYIENEYFIEALQKEINDYLAYANLEPNLKKSEIYKVELNDSEKYDTCTWIMWVFEIDKDPFMFLASTTNPDEFTDTVLNMKKWKEDIEKNGYIVKSERETKNTDYIIA